MRILPVLDLKDGQIVRAIAGRREEYRPVVSPLARSAQPLDVAEGFRTHLGLSELYLADLDAITGGRPNTKIYKCLTEQSFLLWVDAGIRQAGNVERLFAAGVRRVIAGWETVDSLETLCELCSKWGPENIVFSLDLIPGLEVDEATLAEIVAGAVAAGIKTLIVLDVGRVGTWQGTGTEELCRKLVATHPKVEILAGGGVRSREDLLNLQRDGVRGVLIASAFHDGRIRRDDLTGLQG
jgi:phosphoribosylformimino-5-aminoimidazole carboxamide ribotide isomerase